MCRRVFKGIKKHLKRLNLSKSLYPNAQTTDIFPHGLTRETQVTATKQIGKHRSCEEFLWLQPHPLWLQPQPSHVPFVEECSKTSRILFHVQARLDQLLQQPLRQRVSHHIFSTNQHCLFSLTLNQSALRFLSHSKLNIIIFRLLNSPHCNAGLLKR